MTTSRPTQRQGWRFDLGGDLISALLHVVQVYWTSSGKKVEEDVDETFTTNMTIGEAREADVIGLDRIVKRPSIAAPSSPHVKDKKRKKRKHKNEQSLFQALLMSLVGTRLVASRLASLLEVTLKKVERLFELYPFVLRLLRIFTACSGR